MPDFKTKLLAYLESKMSDCMPKGFDVNGRWVGGNEDVFYFIKALIHEVERW